MSLTIVSCNPCCVSQFHFFQSSNSIRLGYLVEQYSNLLEPTLSPTVSTYCFPRSITSSSLLHLYYTTEHHTHTLHSSYSSSVSERLNNPTYPKHPSLGFQEHPSTKNERFSCCSLTLKLKVRGALADIMLSLRCGIYFWTVDYIVDSLL